MAKKMTVAYTLKVSGISESPFRGAGPNDIAPLLEKPDKDTKSLIYSVVKAQVELCLQAGDIEGAWNAIRKYQEQEFKYQAPLNCFKRDMQNGEVPYIGGHAAVGAIRDAIKWLHEPFYQKKGDGNPAKRHFKKAVKVRPYHIFFYRGDKGMIKKIDEVQGQQPTEEVRGFAQYEAILAPFTFEFYVNINPRTHFKKLKSILENPDKMAEVIVQASNHGLGAGRGIGYGMWRCVNIEVVKGIVWKELDKEFEQKPFLIAA